MNPYQNAGDIIPKGYNVAQISNWGPQQKQLFQQAIQQLGPESFLSRLAGGDEEMFQQLEAPARRQFQGTLGNIASRFSGGGLGARHSSGFQHETSQAAQEFAQGLQSQRLGLQKDAVRDLMDMINQLLNQRSSEKGLVEQPYKKNFWDRLGEGIGVASQVKGLFS